MIPAAGALLLACCAAMLALGELADAVPAFLALYALAFAAWALALRRAWRADIALGPVLAVALLARALLLLSPPSLSDDIWRYLWEGRVARARGLAAPFVHAPADAALADLRDAVHARVNHPDVPAAYPPAAQLFFAGAGALSYGPRALKLCLVAVELLGIWLLIAALRARGQPSGRVLAYAWHPLAIVEIAGSGHLEALGVAALAAAVLAQARGRDGLSGAALGLGVMVKLMPAPLLPFAGRPRRGALLGAAAGVAAIAALALPYLGAGEALLAGTSQYATRWRFNESLFALLALPWGEAGRVAGITPPKLLAAALYGALFLALLWRRDRAPEAWPLPRAGVWLMGALLLLAPTVHPWYALWLLPFFCFAPALPWVLLSATLPLAYVVLIDYRASGLWQEAAWVRAAEYAPIYASMGVVEFTAIRRRRGDGVLQRAPGAAR